MVFGLYIDFTRAHTKGKRPNFRHGVLNFRISFQIFRLFLWWYYAIPTTTFYADDDVGCTWYYAMHTTNISILNLALFFSDSESRLLSFVTVCCRLRHHHRLILLISKQPIDSTYSPTFPTTSAHYPRAFCV